MHQRVEGSKRYRQLKYYYKNKDSKLKCLNAMKQADKLKDNIMNFSDPELDSFQDVLLIASDELVFVRKQRGKAKPNLKNT